MKVLIINSFCGIGSTGRICTDLARKFEEDGHEVRIAYGRETAPDSFQSIAVRIGTDLDVKLHGLRTRILDEHGFGSKRITERFLEWATAYNPDLLWLHNLHGYYINIEMLFDWIKKHPAMQVKWTLHDCWAFTGHCAYFTMAQCEQWKDHCSHCVQTRQYPTSLFISSCKRNFERKRKAFTGVQNMTLITPSNWLADLVRKSFLKEYPVEVVYNTVDTNVFKPTPSNFREEYGLQDKKIVLGVASQWTERKGLDDFLKLARKLDDSYAIVLVGLNSKQIKEIPKKVIGLRRTNDAKELAAIYTAADIYVNPSREETFGMTSAEALCCGTQSIVYEDTACAEVIARKGIAIPPDVDRLYAEIIRVCAGGGSETGSGCMLICISRIHSAKELAGVYSAANVFVNPTHEDNYPTVNLEAQACGCYVITYDTGGAAETLVVQV